MRSKTLTIGVIGVVIGLLLAAAGIVVAGSLNPSAGPGDQAPNVHAAAESGTLDTGAAATKMSAFTEPSVGPGGTNEEPG